MTASLRNKEGRKPLGRERRQLEKRMQQEKEEEEDSERQTVR
jgi:hypothetical protein